MKESKGVTRHLIWNTWIHCTSLTGVGKKLMVNARGGKMFFSIFALFLIALCYCKLFCRRHAVVGRYDYLYVLSFTEWKAGRQVKIEMEQKHHGWLSYSDVYLALRKLEEDGLVEHRDELEDFEDDGQVIKLPRRDFRKKPGGIKVKKEEYIPITLVPQIA